MSMFFKKVVYFCTRFNKKLYYGKIKKNNGQTNSI
jgi:uncharacterized pyridoxamine 5'-phosphate oxidase family protein